MYPECINRINNKIKSGNDDFIKIGAWKIEREGWNGWELMVSIGLKQLKQVYDSIFSLKYVDSKNIVFVNKCSNQGNCGECLYEHGYKDGGIISLYIDNDENGISNEKVVFQASHELCHMMMYDHNVTGVINQIPREFLWFEETICEFASWFFIHRIACDKSFPLSSTLSSYLPSVEAQYKEEDTISVYKMNSENIKENPTFNEREINLKFIKRFIDAPNLNTPEFWHATTLIHRLDFTNINTFDELMAKWHDYCPTEGKNIVHTVSSIFGISI